MWHGKAFQTKSNRFDRRELDGCVEQSKGYLKGEIACLFHYRFSFDN